MYMAWRLMSSTFLIAATLTVSGCSNLEGFLPLKQVSSTAELGKPDPDGTCRIRNPVPGTCSCPAGDYFEPRSGQCREELVSQFGLSSPSSRIRVSSNMRTSLEGSCDASSLVSARASISTLGTNALVSSATTSCSGGRYSLSLNFVESAHSRVVDVALTQTKANNHKDPSAINLSYLVNNTTMPAGVLSFTHPAPRPQGSVTEVAFGEATLFRGSCHAPSQHNLRVRAVPGSGVNFDQTYTVTCAAQNNNADPDAWSHSVVIPAHTQAYQLEAVLAPIPNASSPQVQIPVQTSVSFRAVPAASSRFVMTAPTAGQNYRFGEALEVVGLCDRGQRVTVTLFRPSGVAAEQNLAELAFLRAPESDLIFADTAADNSLADTAVPGNQVPAESQLSSSPTGEDSGFKSFAVASVTSRSSASTATVTSERPAEVSRIEREGFVEATASGFDSEIANRSFVCPDVTETALQSFRFVFPMNGFSGELLVEATQSRAPLTQSPTVQTAIIRYLEAPQDLPSSFMISTPSNNQTLEWRAFPVMGPCDPGSQVTLQLGNVQQIVNCLNSAYSTVLTAPAAGQQTLAASQTKAEGYTQPSTRQLNLFFEAILPSQLSLNHPVENQRVVAELVSNGFCDYRPGRPIQEQQMVNVSVMEPVSPSFKRTLVSVQTRCSVTATNSKLGRFEATLPLSSSWLGNFEVWVSANKVFGFSGPALIKRSITIGAPDQLSSLALETPLENQIVPEMNFQGLCDKNSELQLRLTKQDQQNVGPSGSVVAAWTSEKFACSELGTFRFAPIDPALTPGSYQALLTQSQVVGKTLPQPIIRNFALQRSLLPTRFALSEPQTNALVQGSIRVGGRCDPTAKVKLSYLHLPVEQASTPSTLGSVEVACGTGDFTHQLQLSNSVQGQIKISAQQTQVPGTEMPSRVEVIVRVAENALADSEFRVLVPNRDQEAPLESLMFSGSCDPNSEIAIQVRRGGETGVRSLASTRCSEIKTWNWSFNPRSESGLVEFQFTQSQVLGYRAPRSEIRNITFRERDLVPSLFSLAAPQDGLEFAGTLLIKGSCDARSKIELSLFDPSKPELILQQLLLNCSNENQFQNDWDLGDLPKEAKDLVLSAKQSQIEGVKAPREIRRQLKHGEELRESLFAVANPADGVTLAMGTSILFNGTCDMALSGASQSGSGRIQLSIKDSVGQDLVEGERLETVCDKGSFSLAAALKEDFEGDITARLTQSQVEGVMAPEARVLKLKIKAQSLLPSIFSARVTTDSQPNGFLIGTVQQGVRLTWRGLCDQARAKIQLVFSQVSQSGSGPTPVAQSTAQTDCNDAKQWELTSTTLTSQASTLSFQARQLEQIAGYQVPAVVIGQIQVLARLNPSSFEVSSPVASQVVRYTDNTVRVPVSLTCDPGALVTLILRDSKGNRLGQSTVPCPSNKQWSSSLNYRLVEASDKLILEVSQTQAAGTVAPAPAAREIQLVRDMADAKLAILSPSAGTKLRQKSTATIKVQCDVGNKVQGALSQPGASLPLSARECGAGTQEWTVDIGTSLKPGNATLEVKQVDPNELIRPGQVTVRVEIIAAATATTPKSGLEPATEVAAPNFEAERTGATFGIESPNNEL